MKKLICPNCDTRVTPNVCQNHEDCIRCPKCSHCDHDGS